MMPRPNTPPPDPKPFFFYLDQSVQAGGYGRLVIPSPRPTPLRIAIDHLYSTWCYGWRWLQQTRAAKTKARRMRVTETVSLGEKRFLSIVQVDDTQFLIGTSATNVQLLAQIERQSSEGNRMMAATQESA